MDRHPSKILDELLVMRAQDGDVKAFDSLVERCQKSFWLHALYLTQDSDAAWEATQEAWVSIIRDIGKLDDPGRFRHWAYRIVTHKAIDWINKRRSQRSRLRSMENIADLPAEPAVDDSGAIELLAGLNESQRAILSLRYLEGMGVEEIKRTLHLPEGTIKSRLFYARNALRRLFGWKRIEQ